MVVLARREEVRRVIRRVSGSIGSNVVDDDVDHDIHVTGVNGGDETLEVIGCSKFVIEGADTTEEKDRGKENEVRRDVELGYV